MDGGPFRAARPVERRVASRPEQTQRQVEESQPQSHEPKAVHRAPSTRHNANDEHSRKRFILPIILTILLLATLGWLVWSNLRGSALSIDSSKYQAVLLTNGESYFGKLTSLNDDFMKLTDVYYLKMQTKDTTDTNNSQQQTSDDSSFQLIKFGGEVQGPEDEIVFAKKQIVYYENLKPTGKTTQAINQHKKSN